jgi:hypothetical protein
MDSLTFIGLFGLTVCCSVRLTPLRSPSARSLHSPSEPQLRPSAAILRSQLRLA